MIGLARPWILLLLLAIPLWLWRRRRMADVVPASDLRIAGLAARRSW